MDKRIKVTVREGQYLKRIDKFLSENFSDYSRTYFRKRVDQGQVVLNGTVVKRPSISLSVGDDIEVSFPPEKEYEVAPVEVDFEVVFANEYFVIVNKPAGLLVHHVPGSDEVALTSGLMYRFSEMKGFENKERPGIVHRLDRDTSGLMVVARNASSLFKLGEKFKAREVSKTYLVLVHGHPEKEGKIDFEIGRHNLHGHKMSHRSRVGKPALTYYKTLTYYKDCSLVEARLVTGRTHQIRVHFAAIGHSLVGDFLYGKKSKLIKRQALHSWKLSFDYKDTTHTFKRAVPLDFKKALKNANF